MRYPKSHLSTVVLLFVAIAVIACEPAAEQPEPQEKATAEADLEALNKLREEFVSVHNANDASTLATLYTDEAVLMPPNEQAATGKQAIESWFQTSFDQFTAELTLSAVELQVAGDWAFERGTYTISLTPKADGESIEDTGKYVVISQKQADGSWKLASDIWNSDKPLAGPAGEQ